MKTETVTISDDLAAKIPPGLEPDDLLSVESYSSGPATHAIPVWLTLRPLPAQPWAPGVGKHKTRGGGEAEVKFIMDDGRRVGTHTERNGSKSLMAWDAEGRYATRGIHCCDLMPPAPVPPQPEAVSEPEVVSKFRRLYDNGHIGDIQFVSRGAAMNEPSHCPKFTQLLRIDRQKGCAAAFAIEPAVREVREGGAE